jgi:hypothetical protein
MRNIEIKNCEDTLYEKAWDMRERVKAKTWAEFLKLAMEQVEKGSNCV